MCKSTLPSKSIDCASCIAISVAKSNLRFLYVEAHCLLVFLQKRNPAAVGHAVAQLLFLEIKTTTKLHHEAYIYIAFWSIRWFSAVQ